MGQAKKRGTYEVRKAQAMQRNGKLAAQPGVVPRHRSRLLAKADSN